MSKRYLPLESVGSFLDTQTLDILPMNSDGTIRFSERMGIDQCDNPEWYKNLSNEDDQKLRNAAHKFEIKTKTIKIMIKNDRR
jgi:hypothetical protein